MNLLIRCWRQKSPELHFKSSTYPVRRLTGWLFFFPEERILIDTEVLQGPRFPISIHFEAQNLEIPRYGWRASTGSERLTRSIWCQLMVSRPLVQKMLVKC